MMNNRFFFWSPRTAVFSIWPIRFTLGADELGWHTFGVITWFGSVFYRYQKCTCPEISKIYQNMLKENGVQHEKNS